MTPPHSGIRIEDAVVAKIAAIATRDVDGVRVREVAARGPSIGGRGEPRGVRLEPGEAGTAVDVTLVVAYGVPIPRVWESVRRNVIDRIENLMGLRVTEFNVAVDGLFFPELLQPGAGETSSSPREPAEAVAPEARELRVAALVVRVEAASREERRSTRSTAAIAENPPLEAQGLAAAPSRTTRNAAVKYEVNGSGLPGAKPRPIDGAGRVASHGDYRAGRRSEARVRRVPGSGPGLQKMLSC
jgi:uncharacterized alkaline shock family protein YloU